jgi:arylsulfatase A-like enzyme
MRGTAAVLVALLAAGCASPPPPDPLVVAKAFTGERIPGVLNVVDADGRVLGEEQRPVVRYLAHADLKPAGALAPITGGLRRIFAVPPKFREVPLRIKRRYRARGATRWRALPPVLAQARGEQLTVDFPLDGTPDPGAFEVFAVAALVPRPELTQRFANLVVAPGAVLIGGYGLEPETAAVTTAPVEFRITARGRDVERVLLDATSDPRSPTAETWTDYRFDLREFAGQTIEVELQARVRHAEGGDDVGFPVWSVPRILVPEPRGSVLNVILISIDTLRADFVGAYGHERETTPNLDRLAAQGALFERAVAPYPSTTASHMSMLSGLYPQVHGIYGPGQGISEQIHPLAQQLAARGYQTAAITEDGMIAAGAGFARGFADYREYKGEPYTGGMVADVVSSAIGWLGRHANQRFFLFLHTYQVHDPYEPPPAYDVFKTYVVDGAERTAGPDTPPMVRARLGYEGDVLYTDAEIGRLLAKLEEIGEAERTLVVVTADHGEALGEHGVMGHSWFVIEPVLHVPLLLRAPGRIDAGVRLPAPVSLVDIPPTILDLVGVPPTAPMQGVSLAPLLTGNGSTPSPERVVYAEILRPNGADDVVARRGDVKWSVGADRVTRVDLGSDPAEEHAAIEPRDGEGGRLADAYRSANAAFRARLGETKPGEVEVDEAVQNKLRALGYVK